MAASRPVNVACALITLPPVDAEAIRRLSSWGQKKCCLFRVINMATEQLLLLRYRYKAQKKTATSVLWHAVQCKLHGVGDPCVRVLTEDEFEERWQETSSTLQTEATDVEAGAPGVQPRSPPVARVPEDLSAALTQMTDADVSRIRKTKESPPKVSVYDVFQCLFGIDPRNTSRTFARLLESHREELHDEGRPLWTTFKFDGQGQQDTPVADARGIVRIIMLLPCRAAAPVRAKAADVLVRYLGGAPSLMPEIAQDSLPQAQAPDAEDALGHGNPSVTEPRYELLTASMGGDKRQPHPEQVVFVDDFRADLSRLLKKEPGQLGRVRKVEGSPPQYSLIDVIECITGQAATDAAKILRRVVEGDKAVRELIPRIPLPDSTGLRRQCTPVADIQTVLRVIMQLPSRGLGQLKGQICEIFARFMGGDLSLIPELQANHARQHILHQEKTEEPEAVFGEYVRATRPPAPEDIWRTPAPKGVGDYDNKHYILGSRVYPDVCKTGRSTKLMDERLKEILKEQTKDLGLYVAIVYHHEGPLEHKVRNKLDSWGYRQPPPHYGIKGTEFRIVHIDTVRAAMDEVKRECVGKAGDADMDEEEVEKVANKRRRIHLELRQKELELEEHRQYLDERRLPLEEYRERVGLQERQLATRWTSR